CRSSAGSPCSPRCRWCGSAPVSYTHLDVYKRRGDGRGRAGGGGAGAVLAGEARFAAANPD
ncbi:hypothetical protein AZ017_004144, partial [Klebsiella pneumoniae]